ncbi:aldehyde-activating protein [Afipia sp. P52-10]|uniref:GFA family protein n=1 Tax=Afipia sp. P52-10 TaxID=1429916 RepID=UPI0003DF3CC2|nr:GFA family protein [Afipia sp. P52-10]ETR75225.1 aldehyde-activating protein [Afipia sp. P52-10]
MAESESGGRVHEGGCLCGAVRFSVAGAPLNVRICHCRFCQKAHGAPFLARAVFDQRVVRLQGPIGRYPSSPALDRLFCQQCGTRIGAWRVNGSVIGLALALFDDRDTFTPTEHVWISSKLPWLAIDDGLPQYREGVPQPDVMPLSAPVLDVQPVTCD